MHEFDRLRDQMRECGDCLKAFLVKTVDRQPELTEHAGIIREHLETLIRELEVLAGRMS